MATIVTGDLYQKLDGKLNEIKRQMRQQGGYGFDPNRLDLALQAIIEGRFEAVGTVFPSVALALDLIPEYNGKKCEVVEDVAPSQFDVAKLKAVSFLKGEEQIVRGKIMRKRAIELKGNLGLVDGKRLLAEQVQIPVELREYFIVLPGTLLRDHDGDLHVPCLCWDGDQWVLSFDWLDDDWDGSDRLACSE